MRNNPVQSVPEGVKVTAQDLLQADPARLRLKVVVDGDFANIAIEETTMNRPGLALTGFWEDFVPGRVQLIGNAERAYLASLPPAERAVRFGALFEHGARICIFTNGHSPAEPEIEQARQKGGIILATPLLTRDFARDATFVLEEIAAPRVSLYGTMVEVRGLGVLMEGAPGLGKSETALGLIKRGCALVADDLTCLRKDVATNMLFGSASEATAHYMEIRGIGIIHVPSMFGVDAVRGEKRLHLVVTFRHLDEIRDEVDRTGQTRHTRSILGVEIPNAIIPVSEGRDLVNLVETAVQQQKLIAEGYDSVAHLARRLKDRADRRVAAVE